MAKSIAQRKTVRPAALPDQADFSPRAVSRHVLRETLQRPYVLYPAALGILGGVASLLLGPTALFVVPAVAGAALGVGAWAVDFGLRREKHASAYLKRLQEALAGRIDVIVEGLQQDLKRLRQERALAQLDRFQAKYQAVEDLLRRKFDPGEMTFSRYLGMSEQVFLAGLDNLRQIADTQRGINAIDEPHLTARLQAIEKRASLAPAQQQEIGAIRDSLALLQQQRAKIAGWFAENEAAMNQMDRVMAVIAALDTAQDHAQMDMQPALQELKTLLERAHNYARSGDPGPAGPPQGD